MAYVKLPKMMTVNVGRAVMRKRVKTNLLSPPVVKQGIELFKQEVADLNKALKAVDDDDDAKKELQQELKDVQQGLSDFEALAGDTPAAAPAPKAKKGK
jgi:hypothetical protein